MSKVKKETIEAKGFAIQIYTEDFKNDYISLTDIARYKSDEPFIVINNWLRSKDNIQFLGLWESMHNPDFKPIEFDRFRNEAGSNAFTLSPQKWIEKTNAIGIVSKSGRYGGTFAHSDIAMEFASWISPEFKLYIIQDYKRLKSDENSRLSLGWNLNREISKINYKIHTDAIKEYLLKDLTNEQLSYKYASEADMLNVALFNKRAKQWREENPDLKGNMRDYASLNELLVLANMESYNAILIGKGMEQKERMIELRKLARTQIVSLEKLNKKAEFLSYPWGHAYKGNVEKIKKLGIKSFVMTSGNASGVKLNPEKIYRINGDRIKDYNLFEKKLKSVYNKG